MDKITEKRIRLQIVNKMMERINGYLKSGHMCKEEVVSYLSNVERLVNVVTLMLKRSDCLNLSGLNPDNVKEIYYNQVMEFVENYDLTTIKQ